MRLHRFAVLLIALGFSNAAFAQDAPGQTQGQPGPGGGRDFGRGMGMGGAGVMGTITAVASDHFTVKNFAGETWTVNYSANTRFAKQPSRPAGGGNEAGAAGDSAATAGEGRRGGFGGYQPTSIKATDIKVGDAIMAGGEVNRDAKSVGAVGVMLVDPERAKQMQQMQANFGKTWLMGRVAAIDETKVTLEGGADRSAHTFVVDENTSFRRRRDPVTLADVQVGDNVRVDGAIKDGQFVATAVNVMMPPATGGPTQRQGPPPQ